MAIRTRSLAELNRESFDHLLRNTPITMLAPGSIARALVETANRHLENFYDSLALNAKQSYLSEASGVYLDLHAKMFGLTRLTSRRAVIQAADNAIRFYVAQGTLAQYLPRSGNLNQGLIPSGTTIYSDDNSITYVVSRDVTFPATATEVFVPAAASSTGRSLNVGSGVLRNHDLGIAAVKVTNTVSISTGTDPESDDEFRSRISNHLLTQQGSNEVAVRIAALSAPGVADVMIDRHHYGAGSFKLIIIPLGNRVPVDVLQEVMIKVSSVVAFGIYFQIHEPKYLRFNVIVTLRYGRDVIGSETSRIRSAVERKVLDYFGAIPIGGEMVLTELGSQIRNADRGVYDYSINQLCLNGRHQVLHNVRLQNDELFLPDGALPDPVRII